jgi:predicted DNA binding CopG/RHH family protein
MEKIPEFTNSDEELEFWREHDVMEFAGLIDFSDFLRLGGNKSIMVALRMEPVVREQTKKIARDRGKSYQTLMREWIYEGLRKALEEKHEGKSEVEKLREAVMEIKEDLDELKASIDPAKFKKTSNAMKSKKR